MISLINKLYMQYYNNFKMNSEGLNCCRANNVDRDNETYALKESGRYAYHDWSNDLQTEDQKNNIIWSLEVEMRKASKTIKH